MSANLRRILVSDLVIPCEIGVFPHEHGKTQRVRINLDLEVAAGDKPLADNLRNTVSYGEIIDRIRDMIARGGRINLVETLAERIAALCLADRRVRAAKVRVEKLDVYADGTIVGVAIERINLLD